MANHKNNKDADGYRRGERFMSYKEIMYVTGATKEQVYRCQAWLKDDMLTTRNTTRGFIYKVNKYDLYQNLSNYKNSVDDSKDDRPDDVLTTERRQNDDTINKNDKNEKNDKEERSRAFRAPVFSEVQNYCSERKNGIDPTAFIDFYQSKGWMIGKNKMKDWKAAVRTWEQRNFQEKPDVYVEKGGGKK